MAVTVTGGNIRAMGILTVTFDPASVGANTTAEQTATVPGLRVGDVVYASKPTAEAGIGVVNARVSAADTLALTFVNATGSGVNAGSETWTVLWFRPDYATGSANID